MDRDNHALSWVSGDPLESSGRAAALSNFVEAPPTKETKISSQIEPPTRS